MEGSSLGWFYPSGVWIGKYINVGGRRLAAYVTISGRCCSGAVLSAASSSGNHYKFDGMERDSESGLDHTLHRQYASNYGRWLSPDPGGVKVVNLEDPQTWNLYSFVRDTPTTLTDPTGLQQQEGSYQSRGTTTVCAQGEIKCNRSGDVTEVNGQPVDRPTQAQQQSLSPAGLQFIEQHETVGGVPNLTPYDASGKKHLGDWTIGYGHKIKAGEDFSKGITAGQAADLLKGDVQTAVNAVNSALKYPTTFQSQFDSMVSLAYNIRGGAFARSTLVQRWNSGGVVEQPDLFTRFSRTGGAFSPGLYARREEEYTLFNTGEYP